MTNDKQIEQLIQNINHTTTEFLNMPNQCAYTDRLVESTIGCLEELKKMYETNSAES